MYYTCVVSSLRGDHCHQQRASYLCRHRLQTLRPPTQALQWVHFSTLLSTLIQAMKKKAAVLTALGHVTCRHPTTFKTGVIQTTDEHARQDKCMKDCL